MTTLHARVEDGLDHGLNDSLGGARLRRGACPGVVDAMEAADGWLMRIRLPGGAISVAQLRMIADVSATFGSGIVEITSRANLQIRGVARTALDGAAASLISAGLADPDPTKDARRGVVSSPLTGHDATEAVDVRPYSRAIVDALVGADLGGALPPKFGVVVDSGGDTGVRGVPADVVIGVGRTAPNERIWTVVIGGTLQHAERVATATSLDPVTSARAIVAVAEECAATGCRAGALPDTVIDGLLTLFGAEPARLPRARPSATPVGVFDHIELDRCNVIAAPRLGRLDAALAAAIAGVAEAAAAAEIRITTSGVAMLGVPMVSAAALCQRLVALGLSIDATDAVHTVSACVGSTGCAASRADTSAGAAAVIGDRQRSGRAHTRLHLSGCEKLCGAPTDAVALIAGADGAFDIQSAYDAREGR